MNTGLKVLANIWTTSDTDIDWGSRVEIPLIILNHLTSPELPKFTSSLFPFPPWSALSDTGKTPPTYMDQLVIKTWPRWYRHQSFTSEHVLRNMRIWSLNSQPFLVPSWCHSYLICASKMQMFLQLFLFLLGLPRWARPPHMDFLLVKTWPQWYGQDAHLPEQDIRNIPTQSNLD